LKDTSPIVSVIIPVWNGEKYLEEAISSVLAQTYKHLEVIIVNDGSTDGTEDIAKTFSGEIKYFIQSNKGAGAARNLGIKKAMGDYLAFLDADDVWMDSKVARQISVFQEKRKVDMVFCWMENFLCPDSGGSYKKPESGSRNIMAAYLPGTAMIKTESFHKAGFFTTDYNVGEFVEWYSRAKEKGLKDFLINEVLLKRRIHGENTGIIKRDSSPLCQYK